MSGIEGDFDELAELEQRFAGLVDVGERVALRAAPALEAVARGQWAAGQRPDGSAWPATRGGESPPLAGLTSQITVGAQGEAIVMTGPDELRPNFRRRPVWPAPGAELPSTWSAPIEEALREEIDPS